MGILQIIGIVCLVGCLAALVWAVIAHAKDKKVSGPVMVFVMCFLLFIGSGFLSSQGFELNVPEKDAPKAETVKRNDKKDTEAEEPTAQNDTPQDVPEEPEDVPAEVPSNDASGELGDYYVEIKDAVISENRDGDPVVVITYAWTNNSEKTTNAEVAFMEKAFQDGIQLDSAYFLDTDVYDSDLSFKDLRPGTTFDVQCAFKLSNLDSQIEFELSELISFSDDTVIKYFSPEDLTQNMQEG